MGPCGAAMGAFNRIKSGQENRARTLRKRRAEQRRRQRRRHPNDDLKHRCLNFHPRYHLRHRIVEAPSIGPRILFSTLGLLVSGFLGVVSYFGVVNAPTMYHQFTGAATAIIFLTPLFCVSLVSLLTTRTSHC